MTHLLVIGAQRSGTTYLMSVLDAHPEIVTARPSSPEPKVFLSDDLAGRGLEWYRSTYFAHRRDERVLAEKSTSYIEDAAAPARARQVLGDAHILVMLRDPVQRAISNWRFSTAHGVETRPLTVALTQNLSASEPWDTAATSVSPYAYLERGRFIDYLRPWLAEFPARTQVCFLDELTSSRTAIGDVYAALGVDPGFRPPDADQPVNESTGDEPALPAELLTRLRGYFADSDANLRAYLGRELPWATAHGGGH